MELSVLANLYGKKSLDETLKILTSLGVHTVEIGAGDTPERRTATPQSCLPTKRNSTNSSLPSRNMT